jgi:hypothetical protein
MNLLCLFRGHRTVVRYTPLEGQVSCARCGTVTEVWKVLRPEQVAQELREKQMFWARVDAIRRRPVLRRVK